MDILVKWDKGGSVNVVSSNDVKLVRGERLEKGAKVKMLWHRGIWCYGTVEDVGAEDNNEMEEVQDIVEDMDTAEESDGKWSSSDDEALAGISKKARGRSNLNSSLWS